MKKLVLLLFVCLLFFTFWSYLFWVYFACYKIPFGMDDVDRYHGWIVNGLTPDDIRAYVTHYMTVSTLNALNDYPITVNIVIPYLLSFGIPLFLYLFFLSAYNSWDKAVGMVLFYCLGTSSLWFMGLTALWSELFSVFFFIPSVVCFTLWHTGRKQFLLGWAAVFVLIGLLFHPFSIFAYLIFLFVYGLYFRNPYAVIGSATFAYIASIGYPDWIKLVVFFSDFHAGEPNLYHMTAFKLSPILFIYYLIGLRNHNTFLSNLSIVFVAVSVFIHLGRALPFALIFMMPYSYLGYEHVKKVAGVWRVRVITYLFLLFWLDHYFGFVMSNFLDGMLYRGLSDVCLKNIINFKG
jgi:hypothetical protein